MQNRLYEAWWRPLLEPVPTFASPMTAQEPRFVGSWVLIVLNAQSTGLTDVGIRAPIGPDCTRGRLAAFDDLAGPQTPDASIPKRRGIFAEPCAQFFENDIGMPFRGICINHRGDFQGGAGSHLQPRECQEVVARPYKHCRASAHKSEKSSAVREQEQESINAPCHSVPEAKFPQSEHFH